MANLGKLMKLGGAVAAGEFTGDGELVAYKGDLTDDVARLIARMCAANTLMGTSQAENFTCISSMKWTPFHGWAVSAGDFSVCVMRHIGVFVETVEAHFNDIFKILGEEAHINVKAT